MPHSPREEAPHRTGPVVVGVVPEHSHAVVAEAAGFAERFGTELICVSVDVSRYSLDLGPEDGLETRSIDPDAAEDHEIEFDPALREAIARVLDCRRVPWSVRALGGAPARSISRLADELDASMIVVGTREGGLRGSLREFFNGSVAVQLAHTQRRPVVVIPLDPRTDHGVLPGGRDE